MSDAAWNKCHLSKSSWGRRGALCCWMDGRRLTGSPWMRFWWMRHVPLESGNLRQRKAATGGRKWHVCLCDSAPWTPHQTGRCWGAANVYWTLQPSSQNMLLEMVRLLLDNTNTTCSMFLETNIKFWHCPRCKLKGSNLQSPCRWDAYSAIYRVITRWHCSVTLGLWLSLLCGREGNIHRGEAQA